MNDIQRSREIEQELDHMKNILAMSFQFADSLAACWHLGDGNGGWIIERLKDAIDERIV